MIVLTETEAAVYRQLRSEKSINEIGEALDKSKSYVFQVLSYLVRVGAVEKTDKKPFIYTAVQVEYTINARHLGGPGKPLKGRRGFRQLKYTMRLIGKDNLRFILYNYGKMKRRQMAEKLGIRKFDLNHICLVLGLGDAA